MKKLCAITAFSLLSHTALSADSELKSDAQKASYSIGQQIGRSMKDQGVNIDVDTLSASIKDALAGKPSRMTDQEMQAAMMKLQDDVRKKQEELAKGNLEKGNQFLETNKKKSDVKVTASGVQYKVLKTGSGATPTDDAVVQVHYKGTLIDGSEFDSSYKRNQPAEFPVTGVIKGWTESLKMMNVGSKWEVTIPADLAYGKMGRPGIPPNSVLVFEIELLKITEKPKTAEKPAAAAAPAKK